jgi:uncharacterized heparinase superfamily protein
MSSSRQCFIVNCGVDNYGPPELRPLCRATAAHSTATLNETSQARFVHARMVHSLAGAPLVNGPTRVECERLDGQGVQGFVAGHNGYEHRFGIHHEREMRLSENGNVLDGIDRFSGANGMTILANGKDLAAIRFHIHPNIRTEKSTGGEIFLIGQSGECWVFQSADAFPILEESVYFASSSGARRTSQIIISALLSKTPIIRWRMVRETLDTEVPRP